MEGNKTDTIFALSTPYGRSGVAVVRISGSRSREVLELLGVGGKIEAREATCRMINDLQGRPIDQAVILYFPCPASFTGEDVVELQTWEVLPSLESSFLYYKPLFA